MRRLEGTITALVTPFKGDGSLDLDALRRLIERQIQAGVEGILILGTTGEAPALSRDERRRVLEAALKAIDGRVISVAGTGTNNTEATVQMTREAKEMGYDYALVVTPYYNKPTQKGLLAHYTKVIEETGANVIVYNVPGRTGVRIAPETVLEIAKRVPVAGVKEAGGDLAGATLLAQEGIAVLSGDDALTLPLMAVGARGVISVVSNLVPREMGEMVRAALSGEFAKALELHRKLLPLAKALFLETNPIPIKAALSLLGLIEPTVRLPLSGASPNTVERLRGVMESLGII